MLCGAAPLPASSGEPTATGSTAAATDKPTPRSPVVICRLRWDPPTRAYVSRRTTEGISKKEIIRCLKRDLAREIYTALLNPRPSSIPAIPSAA